MKSIIFLCALLAIVFGDSCISVPAALSKDQNCSPGSLGCKAGLYCHTNGKCTPSVAVGQSCIDQYQTGGSLYMCVSGAQCKGPLGSKICVANASPSEACNTDPLSTTPNCGSGLFCNGNGLCSGGRTGDKCFNSTDCNFGANCTNSACAFSPDGAACNNDQLCAIGSFCKSNVCAPRLGLGVQCSANSDRVCVEGAVCVGQSSLDNTVCVANQTRDAGQYCGGYDVLCKGSMKCQNNFCAKQSPDQCYMQSLGDTGSGCIADQFCLCGSNLGYGSGKCAQDSCAVLKKAVLDCAKPVCGYISTGLWAQMTTYANSCINLNCKAASDAYAACSPASSFGVSFSLIFFSLMISFFSKKF